MEIKTIKISQNMYNGVYGEGSVFENSVNITMSKGMFGKKVEKVTNDSILKATCRRSFMDNNLNLVTIELPAKKVEDPDHLIKIVEDIAHEKNRIIKEQAFNLQTYLNKYTVIVNDIDEYEIDVHSDLAKELASIIGLDELITQSNRDIIASINI